MTEVQDARRRVREASKELKEARQAQSRLPIDRENYDAEASRAASERIARADRELRIAKDTLKHAERREDQAITERRSQHRYFR